MSESDQRQRLIRGLKSLHAIPVENPVQPGTPDINYRDGWIECKWLRRWPARASTIVKIDHYTTKQRNWLKKRWDHGGHAWLLLQRQREWLLFSGPVAKAKVGLVTRQELYKCARVRWTAGLKDEELVQCLELDWENWNGLPLVRPNLSSVAEQARGK